MGVWAHGRKSLFLFFFWWGEGEEEGAELKLPVKILLHKNILMIRSTNNIFPLVFTYFIMCLRNKKNLVQRQFPQDNCLWTISPMKSPPGQLPPGLLPPRELALNNSALNNYPQTIALHESPPGQLPPRFLPPEHLPLNNSPSGQLLKIVSSWIVLSLNFTLAKQVLQLGIIVNPSLGL